MPKNTDTYTRNDVDFAYYYSRGSFRVYENDEEELDAVDEVRGKPTKFSIDQDNAFGDKRWVFTIDLVNEEKEKLILRVRLHLSDDPSIDDVSWFAIGLLGHMANLEDSQFLTFQAEELEPRDRRSRFSLYLPRIRTRRGILPWAFEKGTPKEEAYIQALTKLRKHPLFNKKTARNLETCLKEAKGLSNANRKPAKTKASKTRR
jgi:hypothetical protein